MLFGALITVSSINKINDDLIGDVHLVINIINNTKYTRNRLDLTLKIKLSLKESICGFSLTAHKNLHIVYIPLY